MRLSPVYQAIIKAEAIRVFGENVAVFLFGSRVDDSKQGGDIDLHIQIHGIDPSRLEKSRKLAARICAKLGDILPIDVVVQDDATADNLIHQEGMRGILL